jgi:hypothetical protein
MRPPLPFLITRTYRITELRESRTSLGMPKVPLCVGSWTVGKAQFPNADGHFVHLGPDMLPRLL